MLGHNSFSSDWLQISSINLEKFHDLFFFLIKASMRLGVEHEQKDNCAKHMGFPFYSPLKKQTTEHHVVIH